jgi:hypothetical protein
MPPLRRCFLPLLGLALLLMLGACSHPQNSPEIPEQTTYYIDANLGFAIEHPQDWTRTVPATEPDTVGTISWAPLTGTAPASLAVIAMTPQQAVGGFDHMLEIFTTDKPGFTTTVREPLDIPGAAAEKVVGQTPAQAFELILVTASRNAFILALSTPPGSVADYQDLFDKVVDSFRIIP